jgi:hypothetical protein
MRDAKDRNAAAWIRERLQQEKIEVWSPDSIKPGANWLAEIQRAIESADAILLLLSRHSTESANVTTEVYAAIASQHRRPYQRIIPILLDNEVKLPFFLRRHQFIDFSKSESRAFPVLLAALRGAPAGSRKEEQELERRALEAEEEILSQQRTAFDVAWEVKGSFFNRAFLGLLAIALVGSLIVGLFVGLEQSLINGLLVGLLSGLVLGLVMGLVFGILSSDALNDLWRRLARQREPK